MKIKEFPFSLWVLVAVWVVPLPGMAQTFQKERSVSRSFLLKENTEIEVTNKYGDIHLIPWEEDSVRFDIQLQVKSTKESKLEKTYDFINFDFKANDYYVIAETVFEQGGSFWSEVSDIANNLFSAGTSTAIDYTIHLPKNANLSIHHKYGNIFITDLAGKLTIDLSNGDIRAHNLSGETNLSVNFGDVDIHSLNNATITVNYGEFRLTEANHLTLNNRSSSVYAEQIDHLMLDAKRSKYYLNSVNHVSGEGYFSILNMEHLNKTLNLNTRYGTLEVTNMETQMESMEITSEETEINLVLNPQLHFQLNLLVTEKTEVLYSAKITDIHTDSNLTGDKKVKASGEFGNKKNKAIPLNINSNGGRISLKVN